MAGRPSCGYLVGYRHARAFKDSARLSRSCATEADGCVPQAQWADDREYSAEGHNG